MTDIQRQRLAELPSVTRRGFFDQVSQGTMGAALTYLLSRDLYGDSRLPAAEPAPAEPDGARQVYDLKPRQSHFEPEAKSVIHLFMNGGPSHMDLFDPKPMLNQHHGRPYLDQLTASEIQGLEEAGALLGSSFQFAPHGESGVWLSEALPHLAKRVDDIAFIRSMFTSSPSHERALYKIHSGRILPGLPTLGSWITYGLGSENQNLPAYVVLDDPLGLPVNGVKNWQAGYLPPLYQGTRLRSTGTPILNLHPEVEDPPEIARLAGNLLSRLDRIHKRKRPRQPQLDARIASYELAARMQLAATDALDLSQETKQTLEMYGVGNKPKYTGRLHPMDGPDSYARRCIMARRLVERGVQFVQIFVNSQIWDMHSHLENEIRAACDKTDKPVAALLKDLKQRGLLDSTLVIWGGEFGRLPISEYQNGNRAAGRDHNPHAFTSWMSGGGVKGGTVYGATDDFGYRAVENRVSVADFHATILHLLGLHHDELFFERNGLNDKLTFTNEARVVKEILA